MSQIWLPSGVLEGPEYGTPEWFGVRRGRVTASRFKDVLTEPRSKAAKEAGELSETANGYLLELVAAAITGQDRVGGKSMAMDRGVDMEQDALDAYERSYLNEVQKGRLVYRQHEAIGATPDGFVEEDAEGRGIIEVKCPESKTHLQNWLSRTVPDVYYAQVQGQLWVTERDWCDFVSFDDRFPAAMQLVRVRVYPDEAMFGQLDEAVRRFAARVAERIAEVDRYLADCEAPQAAAVQAAAEAALQEPGDVPTL